jgi:hypothetical protein
VLQSGRITLIPKGVVSRYPQFFEVEFRFRSQSCYSDCLENDTLNGRERPIEYYPTPAPNAELIRKPLPAGRHLIILNRSSTPKIVYSNQYAKVVI